MRRSLSGSHCRISLASLTYQNLLFTCLLFLQLPWLRSHCPVISSHAVGSSPGLRNCQWVTLHKLPGLSIAGWPHASTGKGQGRGRGGGKKEEEKDNDDMESSLCHISRAPDARGSLLIQTLQTLPMPSLPLKGDSQLELPVVSWGPFPAPSHLHAESLRTVSPGLRAQIDFTLGTMELPAELTEGRARTLAKDN